MLRASQLRISCLYLEQICHFVSVFTFYDGADLLPCHYCKWKSPSSFPVLCLPWMWPWPCSPTLSLPSSKAHIFILDSFLLIYFFASLVGWTDSLQVQWVPRAKLGKGGKGIMWVGKAYLFSVTGTSYISLSHII